MIIRLAVVFHLAFFIQNGEGAIKTDTCASHKFKCKGGNCINETLTCDGADDCGDWSDEDTCVCDEGWTNYQGRCYKAENSEDGITWIAAKVYCKEKGAFLTTILNSAQEKFLLSILPEDAESVYIGLWKNLLQTPGKFRNIYRWADKTPYIYRNWLTDQPDGATLGKCTMMNITYGWDTPMNTTYLDTYGWDDIFCGQNITDHFICMKKRERQVFNLSKTCMPNQFQCGGRRRCISMRFYCDGRRDCVDGSDENNCNRPQLPITTSIVDTDVLAVCTDNGELRSRFKRCDGTKDCTDGTDEKDCDRSRCPPDMYRCQNRRCVSLTFYCDGVNDCGDTTDESICPPRECAAGEWKCTKTFQCINESKRCDHNVDCLDTTDEQKCITCDSLQCYDGRCLPKTWVGDGIVDCNGGKREDEDVTGWQYKKFFNETNFSISVSKCTYHPDSHGKVILNMSNDETCAEAVCPNAYFKCPKSYCIPVYLVCNSFLDCPNGEDEVNCGRLFAQDGYKCPGYYHCYRQGNCVDPSQVCDGIRQCLDGDDERYCDHKCPPACECAGRDIKCNQSFPQVPLDVRKLDLSGVKSVNGTFDLKPLKYLTVVILSNCDMYDVKLLFKTLRIIISVDLSYNLIQTIDKDTFSALKKLKFVDLSHNILLTHIEDFTFSFSILVEELHLQNTSLEVLGDNLFYGLDKLRFLNISLTDRMKNITNESFAPLKSLDILDIRHTHAERFGCCFLKSLKAIETLYVDSYHLCCDTRRPDILSKDRCIGKPSMIASCDNLIGQDALRLTIWSIGGAATAGALLVLVFRCAFERRTSLNSYYGVYLTNLTISDFLMGAYLLGINTADYMYRGFYESEDYEWRNSYLCKGAGAVAMLSSEASCIFVLLITFDRYITIRYPFGRIRFSCMTTTIGVLGTWLLSALIAGVPLLPDLDHWDFYANNSICMALPPYANEEVGWQFTSAIFVGFNFSICLFTGILLISIYRKFSSLSEKRMGKRAAEDEKSARRVFPLLFTDFLCWLYIGGMGIQAHRGNPAQKAQYIWTLVAVIPMNAALNPFLYMFSSIYVAWSDYRKPKGAVYNPQEYLIPRDSNLEGARAFVGNPTNNMVSLRSLMESQALPRETVCGIISLVTAYLFELKEKRKIYEPVGTHNIFIHQSREKKVDTVCLDVSSDRKRTDMGDDIISFFRDLIVTSKQMEDVDKDEDEDKEDNEEDYEEDDEEWSDEDENEDDSFDEDDDVYKCPVNHSF